MKLVIGNKNYSSWSMRPWVLMKGLGLPFEEIKLSFNIGFGAPFTAAVQRWSPGVMAMANTRLSATACQ